MKNCKKSLQNIKTNTELGEMTIERLLSYYRAKRKQYYAQGYIMGTYLDGKEFTTLKVDNDLNFYEQMVTHANYLKRIKTVLDNKTFLQKQNIN